MSRTLNYFHTHISSPVMSGIKITLLYIIYVSSFVSCSQAQSTSSIIVGAEQMESYLPMLKSKNIALVVNPTSTVKETHLVDTLLSHNITIKTIFAPEHGFRGNADAGETVKDGKDSKTSLPIISLYGKNKKPHPGQLKGIDLVIFDIQDVGVRFYTYISTMHYVMEACAENNIPLLILDRPNPNGHYTDGPVLKETYRSFVGMHPIPVVHGLTVGELALMINGEAWLKNEVRCELTVIPVKNWNHQTPYPLPVKPSPNLPNAVAINLYPSLCFFEPTQMSIGRGTYFPFQVIGSPKSEGNFTFTPKSIDGMSKYPKHENEKCYGSDLRKAERTNCLNIDYLLSYYNNYPDKENFFTNAKFFNLLAGNATFQQQIKDGLSAEQIKQSWQKDLLSYRKTRSHYLLYP